MKFYVYELVRVSDGKVLYVGKGHGKRLKQHRYSTNRFIKSGQASSQPRLYSALAVLVKSGDNFKGRKVFESDNEFSALCRESELILHYGIENLLNDAFVPVFWPTSPEEAAAARASLRWKSRNRKQTPEQKKQRELKRAKRRQEKWAKLEEERKMSRSERSRAKQHERQVEIDRLIKLRLNNSPSREWMTGQDWAKLLANTGAERGLTCERIGTLAKRKREQIEWEEKLLARKIAAPTKDDFTWGTARHTPARQILDFLYTPD